MSWHGFRWLYPGWGLAQLIESAGFCILPNLISYQSFFLWVLFLPYPPFRFWLEFWWKACHIFCYNSTGLRFCSFFFFLNYFLPYHSDWVISIVLPSSSLIPGQKIKGYWAFLRVCNSWIWGGAQTLIFKMFPGDADAASLGTTLRNTDENNVAAVQFLFLFTRLILSYCFLHTFPKLATNTHY